MAEVIEINDIHELAAHRLAAHALLDETPHASFLHSIDWLEAYWRHYGANQRLRVLIVRAAGKTIGVAPFVVRTRPSKLGAVRALTYPLDNWGCWFGPLGGNRAATLRLAFRHLDNTPRDWDVVELPGADHHGEDRGRTLSAMRGVGWRPVAVAEAPVSSIDLAGGYDAYLASRTKRFRHELRRARRRLAEQGRLEFVRYRPAALRDGGGDPQWTVYDACEQVAANSWQARSTSGNTLSHPACRRFLRDAHEAATRQGAADMALLKLDGRPIAFAYNYHREGRLIALRMGYDRSLPASLGVGKTLISMLVEDSCRRGDQLIDLGEGNDAYKRHWRTGVRQPWKIRAATTETWRGCASLVRNELTARWGQQVG